MNATPLKEFWDLQTIHLLLVEDNPDDAMLIRRVFLRASRQDWKVVQVERLAEAISVYREYQAVNPDHRSFDVVLLDLRLPDSTGLDTVTQFCNAIPDVPVVVLSALDDEALALRAIQAGAQDYLLKERTTIEQLLRSIRYAIVRKTLLKQQSDRNCCIS